MADAGLLSKDNLKALQTEGYQYILGARIKNESAQIKQHIQAQEWKEGKIIHLSRQDDTRLIVAYSQKRARKDQHNRQRGLSRLEKQIKRGRLTKSNINNRGYNKYLKLEGELTVKIDYQKFKDDEIWDGLKGYITNTKLTHQQIIDSYNNLWHIEKAFRMSKTDLRVRPIYHRLRHRIEAHICIAFIGYCIYKELERILYKEKSNALIKESR